MKNQIQIQTEGSRAVIAARAYQLWESAGRPLGRDLEHWLQAEAELNAANHLAVVKFVPAGASAKAVPAHSVARPQARIPTRQAARSESRIHAC